MSKLLRISPELHINMKRLSLEMNMDMRTIAESILIPEIKNRLKNKGIDYTENKKAPACHTEA